jgi:hypothetical protein
MALGKDECDTKNSTRVVYLHLVGKLDATGRGSLT